jgi:uncharacterized membrane protein
MLITDIDWSAVVDRFHALSWILRIDVFVLAWISITSFRASRLLILNKTWRRVYHFICGISTLVFIYVMLLFSGAINRTDYARLTSSMFPILLFALGLPPLMHIWEQRDIAQAIEKKKDETPPRGLGQNG